MYLLDTNVVSEIRKIKQGKANANVGSWLSNVVKDALYINVIVLMEIERGILGKYRKDPAQARNLKAWYDATVPILFADRVVVIDAQTASICANLHIPDRASENDAWIAASAIQHNLTLVTRNTKDFQYDNLRVFNPFASTE